MWKKESYNNGRIKQQPAFSDEFRLLVEKPPGWFLRSGLVLLLGLFTVFFVFCWLGKYPDGLTAELRIMASTGRMRILARKPGSLSLFVREGTAVRKDEWLGMTAAEVQNKAGLLHLVRRVDLLFEHHFDSIYSRAAVFREDILVEEMEVYYDEFLKRRREYFVYRHTQPNRQKRRELLARLDLGKKLLERKNIEYTHLTGKVDIEKNRLAMANHLYENQVIATANLDDAREKALDKLQLQEVLREDLLKLDIEQHQIASNIAELDIQIIKDSIEFKGNLTDAFRILYSKLKEWENAHLLKAPADGTVYFSAFWSEGQTVDPEQEIMSVVPAHEHIVGVANVGFQRAGELAIGQKVNIYLESYLSEDYGIIHGRVSGISPIPNDTSYRLTVELPQGLITSYSRQIPFSPELHGNAEIITRNTTILQKVFNKLRHVSDRVNPSE